jgi:aminopeptidase
MANLLVNYSVGVQPGQWVVVESNPLGEPMVAALVEEVLKAGGLPTPTFFSEAADLVMLRHANDQQLSFVAPIHEMEAQKADVQISIGAPANTRARAGIDPSRLAVQQKGRERILTVVMERAAQGSLRWTYAMYPTNASAQDAGMSLEEYEDFVYGAGLLDRPDPVAAWKEVGERNARLIEWLRPRQTVLITGPMVDLKVGVAGRTWDNDDGRFNFPGGEIYTGPQEDVTEGYIQFSYPAYEAGREATDVRLVFESGRVTEASASSGEDFLLEMLNMDEGARRLGEFAFGTNYGIQRFTKNTLFDEKIGGTLHMALGASYPETGGQNQSALHWDIVHNLRDGTEVRVDGELFSKNGEFCV